MNRNPNENANVNANESPNEHEHERQDRCPSHDRPKAIPVPESLERAITAETSLRARMPHVAVGLASGRGAAFVALLRATEPGALPVRTRIAFGALIPVGSAWAVFAARALTERRPLYGHDRVLAASIALAATTATTALGTAVAASRGTTTATTTTALTGTTPVVTSALLPARARGRRRRLLRLRDELRAESP
ncbi:transmembrane transport protein (plasmid) [Embleya sp. NBC_00888]|uniref:transmembrane transport protein n=1 Tax=Embleya sp. NBC_00888 TaxID=2975960 RepID=UPI002F9100FE|nr:transmembrane transport protein [Embleya sp. NBC_00888]